MSSFMESFPDFFLNTQCIQLRTFTVASFSISMKKPWREHLCFIEGKGKHRTGAEVTSTPKSRGWRQERTNCKPLKHIISIYENGQDVHGKVCDADSVVWKISSSFKRGAACKHWYADELLTLQNIVNNDKTITASDFSSKHEDEKHDLIYARHKKQSGQCGLHRIELRPLEASDQAFHVPYCVFMTPKYM